MMECDGAPSHMQGGVFLLRAYWQVGQVSCGRNTHVAASATVLWLCSADATFGELRDVYSFECRACGVWHIEEADALEGAVLAA
jgi:hypothetical protein